MNVCLIKIKYILTFQNISNKTILPKRVIFQYDLRLNDDDDLVFFLLYTYFTFANYSMNVPHVSSSYCNRFVPNSCQFAY